jgi:hypothetical protein
MALMIVAVKYLPLQKISATFRNKFFGFLRALKYRLYIALEKVVCYVVCKGPP